MTAFLAIGYQPGPFTPAQGPLLWWPAASGAAPLDRLTAGVEDALRRHRRVVAVLPRWLPGSVATALSAVRSMLCTSAVVTYPTLLPPLAGAVLVSVASALARRSATVGALLGALPLLERELVAQTWLRSVARLRRPAPTPGQRLLSWWPASAFLVSSWPPPRVTRLRGGEGRPWWPRPHEATGLALADRGGAPQMVRHTCTRGGPGVAVCEVAPTPLGPAYWGTPRLTEAVVYPRDTGVLAERLFPRVATAPCRWCGEPVAAGPCPFCGHHPQRQPAAVAA